MAKVQSPTDPDRVFEDDDGVEGTERLLGQTGDNIDPSFLPSTMGPQGGLLSRMMKLFSFGTKPTPVSDIDFDATDELDKVNYWENTFSLTSQRTERHTVYDEMDTFDLIRAFLDAYAEEATQPDRDTGKAISIQTADNAIRDAAHNVLIAGKFEDRLPQIARNIAKYGEEYYRLVYAGGEGIQGMRRTVAKNMERYEDKYDRVIGFAERNQTYRGERKHNVSWPWDYVHFRLLGSDYDKYGSSLLTGWFRPWRQLCVAAGTLVWTDRGPVPIEDLEPGEQTYCHDHKTGETFETPVVAVLNMGTQPLVRIKTRHRSIDVTPNHGMLVRQSDGSFVYKKAEEIVSRDGRDGPATPFDHLVLPVVAHGPDVHTVTIDPSNYYVHLRDPEGNPVGGGEGVMSRISRCRTRMSAKNVHTALLGNRPLRADDFDAVSKEFSVRPQDCDVTYRKSTEPAPFNATFKYTCGVGFARFLGFMLGDGWLNANVVGFALGVDDNQNQRYIDLAKNLLRKSHYTYTDAIEGKRGAAVQFNTAAGVDLMRSAGFVTGFANKRVPDWVFSMSWAFREELLRGLCDADGGYQTDGVSEGHRVTLANKVLVEQLWTLAQSVGWGVSSEVKEIIKDDRQPAYRIWLSERTDTLEVMYEAVLSVEPIGEGATYDLQVEHDLHNFTANGVVSHNTLAEDATLMYRLRRAPDRNLILVDTGDMDTVEQVSWLNRWKKRFRKTELIDPASPAYRKQYNPLTPLEDIFMTISRDSTTRVESLAGTANVGEIYDLEFFRDKLFGAARVPKAYFGFEGDINAKATLMQQDIRFARTIKRLQKSLILGIRHAINIDGALRGMDMNQLQEKFVVQLATVSMLEELERLEALELRNRVVEGMANWAQTMQIDTRVWATYLLINFAKLPEELVLKLIRKTPDAPPAGGMGMEGDDGEDNGLAKEGYYALNEKEKKAIAEMVHQNGAIRQQLCTLHELFEDDINTTHWESQMDVSTILPNRKVTDNVADDPEKKLLLEHLESLQPTTNDSKGSSEEDDVTNDTGEHPASEG